MPEFKIQKALVLSHRRLGENTWVLSLFSKEVGKCVGAYKKKLPPQIGSFVEGRWQARLPEQMGSFYVESTDVFCAGFLDDKKRLACLTTLCALLDSVLPERQECADLYEATLAFLNKLEQDDFLKHYVRWEMHLLETIGYGLDCSKCAGGGSMDLAYISPKTGRAVSREMGEPYKDKLIPLPAFLWKEVEPSTADIRAGLNLTGYFFKTYSSVRELPQTRGQLF